MTNLIFKSIGRAIVTISLLSLPACVSTPKEKVVTEQDETIEDFSFVTGSFEELEKDEHYMMGKRISTSD